MGKEELWDKTLAWNQEGPDLLSLFIAACVRSLQLYVSGSFGNLFSDLVGYAGDLGSEPV